jgi:hypothetical protein
MPGKLGAQYAKPTWEEFPIPPISPPNDRKRLKDLNAKHSLAEILNSLREKK